MNNRFIPIISVLMSISVIIFVTLQIKWTKEYYSALDQDFSNKVSAAMDGTVKKINDIEADKYLNQDFKNFGTTVTAGKDQPSLTTIQQVQDSATKKILTYQRSVIEKQDLPLSSPGDSMKITKLWKQGGIERIRKIPGNTEPLTAELNSSINSGEYALKEFVKINASNMPIEKRVDAKILDTVLTKELKANGVNAEFNYAILDKADKPTKLSKPDFKSAKTPYTAPLFTDDKDRTLYTLALAFPDKNFSLIRNYYPMLLGTFFSLLTILGIYIISINYMMKQKKIADIKTDFINNMSHEFKTPLATISVATDSLSNDKIATNPEKVKYYSQLIKQENLRMKKQVENVLNMSKLERNEVNLFLKETNVRELIKNITESFQLIVDERGGTLTKEFTADRYNFKIDEFHISNVLVNLLDNANKYSPEAPQIKVKTRNEGNYYVIEISDKGLGMDVLNKTKIFEKFFREETGNIHNVKGQGLGLTYVKKIVELQKGKIDVETQKGKGSTFIVKLPMS